jgi:hypothetical protein
MGLDNTQSATGVTTTSDIRPTLKRLLSSWSVTETAGVGGGIVKIRDTYNLPSAITSAADGAAGNSTVGLHMFTTTWVTPEGESQIGPQLEWTAAASKIVNLTGVPTATGNSGTPTTGVIGRRIYETKAGAPATGVTPTSAQWFRVVDDFSTTLAAGMNALPLPQATITVASTTGFAAAGNILVTTANGIQAVVYTSVNATNFLGCTGGSGLMATSGAVTQPAIGDNTTTTFAANVADASLVNTRPSTQDKAGSRVVRVNLAASQSVGEALANPRASEHGGGFYVEITSGTVDWELGGK